MNTRLPFDATTYEEIYQYYDTRAKQLAYADFKWSGAFVETNFGLTTTFVKDNTTYSSAYVLFNNRGRNLLLPWLRQLNNPVVTIDDCHIESYLKKHKISYVIPVVPANWTEYKLIENEYSDKRAKRSGVFLMNHIDEGLLILKKINANIDAQKAYCLHPLFQTDEDLLKNTNLNLSYIDPKVLMYAMEYRSVANEYLSSRTIKDISEIRLSPLKQVNDMLIADKVQNYKDFCLYHKNTHARSKELDQYFKNWLKKLDCENLINT